ncbi:MAG: hypothetical protein QW589_05620 [Candidatus Bathyarchaeia archaeon]
MWLIILAFSATIATAIWYSKVEDDKYMLKFLSLILWGSTIMIFVDHLMSYLIEGEEFLKITTEATVLGITLLIIALIIWEIGLLLKDPKGALYKRKST